VQPPKPPMILVASRCLRGWRQVQQHVSPRRSERSSDVARAVVIDIEMWQTVQNVNLSTYRPCIQLQSELEPSMQPALRSLNA
jgi:hypothetical protein